MSEPVLDASFATDFENSASLAEMVRRAQARDHAAFEYLYRHFRVSIWRRLTFLVGEKEIVNDLLQETFLRAWKGLPGTSADLQFGPWLKRIAANAAIDYLRHKAAIEFSPLTDSDREEPSSLLLQVAGPETSVSERECIEQALAAMLPRYRICVLLQDQWGIYALDGVTGAMRWQKPLGNISFSSPVIDHGNLYMTIDVFANSQQMYPLHLTRMLLAIQGSDGRTLWLQDIPWNKGRLGYSMIEPPIVSVSDGRIYLVDWQPSANLPSNLKAMMGAFSESNGSLLWSENVTQSW